MMQSADTRRQIVSSYLDNVSIDDGLLKELRDMLVALENIPKKEDKYILTLCGEKNIGLDLSYEINEIKKDLLFLEDGEAAFDIFLAELYPGFDEAVNAGYELLKDVPLRNFITDRDGTINNYCGRYASSTQSVYNSIYLSRFAEVVTDNSVILTSAPLEDIGLVDISVNKPGIFIYAGAKGRRYIGKDQNRGQKPIKEFRQKKLDAFNKKIKELVKKKEYQIYTFIGSGLQFKFGQTTIARQNMAGSIPEDVSRNFLDIIKNMVGQIDPDKEFLRIEDTGTDIEVLLTIESDEDDVELKDFDKGDGVKFLNEALGLDLGNGANLICGDTNSDVPMVPASMDYTKDTWAIFVTRSDELKEKVREVCPNSYFVPEPDMLVAILNKLAKGKK